MGKFLVVSKTAKKTEIMMAYFLRKKVFKDTLLFVGDEQLSRQVDAFHMRMPSFALIRLMIRTPAADVKRMRLARGAWKMV